MLDDAATRALAHRFFDAVEAKDVETMAALYAPELKFWFNVTGKESTREENLKAVEAGASLHKSRSYNDRVINTFAGGFVVQYGLEIIQHSGAKTVLWACFVAQLNKDGLIARIDEYIDSGKFPRREKRPAEAKA